MEVARTADGQEALSNLGNISSFVEIYSLEDINLWNTPFLATLLESVDVLHLFELASCCVDLGNATRHELVHEVAENDAILKDILKGSVR